MFAESNEDSKILKKQEEQKNFKTLKNFVRLKLVKTEKDRTKLN
jgi:hypothetical protein